jgi:amino acid permease
MEILNSSYPNFIKKKLLTDEEIFNKLLIYAFIIFPVKIFSFIFLSIFSKKNNEVEEEQEEIDKKETLQDL